MISSLIRSLLLVALIVMSPVLSQTDRFDFDLRLINPDAQVFTIGDIGIIQNGSVPEYYLITLTNLTNDPIPMRMRINYRFNGTVISTGNSNDFILPPQSSPVAPFTNTMVEVGVPLSNGTTIRIDSYDTDFTTLDDLESQVRTTGRIPSGTYAIQMVLFELNSEGEPIEPGGFSDLLDNHTLFISNPSTLDLLFPGQSLSAGVIEEVFTNFPFFQWYTDAGPQISSYRLQVFEKRPEHFSVQDVLNGPPVLDIDGINETFIQYPTENAPPLLSGQILGPVRPLENGREYYWQVIFTIPSASGDISLESDVFAFRIANDVRNGNFDPRLVSFIEQILGPQYRSVLEDLLQSGFQPNGEIVMNGNRMDINDLMLLLGRIIGGNAQVKEVTYY